MALFLLVLFLVSILITATGKYLKGDFGGPGHPPDFVLFVLYFHILGLVTDLQVPQLQAEW